MKPLILALALVNLAIYLFASAPPPLEALAGREGARLPVRVAFEVLDRENAAVRALYTREIVGAGAGVGLEFEEDWRRPEVKAAPLPSLFLRQTALHLERSPAPLGLFLGSDQPINASNRFSSAQAEAFAALRQHGEPVVFWDQGTARSVAMFPDPASAAACVDCHNRHAKSPKRDWALGDLMGATTWTHPAEEVSGPELLDLVRALRGAVASAWRDVLEEASTFESPPAVGDCWPRDGYCLPSEEVFMRAMREETSVATLDALLEVDDAR